MIYRGFISIFALKETPISKSTISKTTISINLKLDKSTNLKNDKSTNLKNDKSKNLKLDKSTISKTANKIIKIFNCRS